MAEPLTYDILNAAQRDLMARFRAYIPLLQFREQWRPELDGIGMERPNGYRRFVILVNVFLIEWIRYPWSYRRPLSQYIHLTYGITADGSVSCITAPQANWLGAERVYQEPVQFWVDAVWRHLQEEGSKQRIQERTRLFHEELVAAVWAPVRLSKRLEEGGWDAVEAFI